MIKTSAAIQFAALSGRRHSVLSAAVIQFMRLFISLMLSAVFLVSGAFAESLPFESSLPASSVTEESELIFSPGSQAPASLPQENDLPQTLPSQQELTQEEPVAQELAAPSGLPDLSGELHVDFSSVSLSDPASTPVAVDPIDKPTPTPAPSPNFVYQTYENTDMGVSFSIPYSWNLNPGTAMDTNVQFVEPREEIMDVNGYQSRLTVEKVNMGLSQNAADARTRLESVLEVLSESFSSFSHGSISSATVGNAKGSYCYYKAEYSDGVKTYQMNGRICIVAHGNSLYQIRLTAPRDWYAYYEHVFRRVRSTFKFL